MPHRTARRGTILIPSGPDHDPDRMHLFIICTDPCANGLQVLVPLASLINDLCDKTCILQKYEHKFLTHESYVLYRKARLELNSVLLNGIIDESLIAHEVCNGQTFTKVNNGICNSPHTPRKIKFYLGCPTVAIIPSTPAKPD